MTFDVASARAAFPILERQVHGKPLIYLDSAASAQKPRAVIEAMSRAMERSYANVHRGLHTLANETTDAYEAARRKVAAFISAGEHEVVFTRAAPRRSTWWPQAWAPTSSRGTKSSSRRWSITPTSCPGISSGSGRAWC